jgi:hypothetical protein
MSHVSLRFIFGVRLGRSPLKVLASVAGFSGMVTWPSDLLEGNILAIDTLVYEDIEEVSSFVAIVSSSLDVPLLAFEWGVTTGCRSFGITSLV